jgi:hypothetical protein
MIMIIIINYKKWISVFSPKRRLIFAVATYASIGKIQPNAPLVAGNRPMLDDFLAGVRSGRRQCSPLGGLLGGGAQRQTAM